MITFTLRPLINTFTRLKGSRVDLCTRLTLLNTTNARGVHITSITPKDYRVGKVKLRHRESKDEVLEGVETIDIDSVVEPDSLFVNDKTENKIFDGLPFKELPIINIKATKNNTIITMTDYKGKGILLNSCGVEGFKNAKKGTNIAAQQTASNLGVKTLEKGVKTVRVRVQGIGPGRMAAVKGLSLAGLNIVSITDDTRVSWNPPRPRKQRRI